jgi:hypothetical protein
MYGIPYTMTSIKKALLFVNNFWIVLQSSHGERGDGVFLILYKADDLDKALSELKAKGAGLIDQEPRALCGTRYAFVQKPHELCGILTGLLDGEFDVTQVTDIHGPK